MHDIEIDHCKKCLSNGKCLKGDQDFICLCSQCYQGDLCEFNLQAFGFTIDSLLVDYSKEMKIIYLLMTFLLFLIGFFNNLCSFITFKRSLGFILYVLPSTTYKKEFSETLIGKKFLSGMFNRKKSTLTVPKK